MSLHALLDVPAPQLTGWAAWSHAQAQDSLRRYEDTLSRRRRLAKEQEDRLVAKAWDAGNRGKYAMGRYTSNTIKNEDLLYVLSSKIVGQDLSKTFEMYGLPLSPEALGSVQDLKLPLATRSFYALPAGKHNQLATGQWVSLQGQSPAYPY